MAALRSAFERLLPKTENDLTGKLLPDRWLRTLPATDLALFELDLLLSTFDASAAVLAEDSFFVRLCERALPAKDLVEVELRPSRKTFVAVLTTLDPVFALFVMFCSRTSKLG